MAAERALPAPGSALVGRDAEVAAVRDEVATQRLVTLTGPPGVGKTRLALAVAHGVRDAGGAVAWVELAAVRDSRLVLDELADALALQPGVDRPPAEAVAAALGGTEAVVVLDNCEHLPDLPSVVADLLVAAPGLRVLATSRQSLHLSTEREHPVPPLPMPSAAEVGDLRRLAASPAVALMLNHAPAYVAVTPRTAQALVEIAVRLDGLPLALEFAAARMRVFTPGELAFRLERRLSELASAAVDVPDRHRDLRAAITWSHDLLPASEQAVFRRLSVFAGGWDLAGAAAVCTEPGQDLDVVAAVESLLDKSLVRRTGEDGPTARFQMLLSLREYAAGQLEHHGEVAATRSRHAAWFAAAARDWEASVGTPVEDMTWSEAGAIRADLDAAVAHSLGTGDAEAVWWLEAALGMHWYVRGAPARGRPLLDLVRDEAAAVSADAGTAALVCAAVVAIGVGAPDLADHHLRRSLDLSEERGDRRRAAIAKAFRGHAAREQGRLDDAAAYYEQACSTYAALGNELGTAWSSYDLGLLELERGDHEAAARLLASALERFAGDDYAWATAVCSWALALARLAAGEADDAATLLSRALELHRAIGDRRGTAQVLEAVAELAFRRGLPATAGRLAAAADGVRVAAAARPSGAEHHRLARLDNDVVGQLGRERTDHERRAGRSLTLDAALALAQTVLAPASGTTPAATLTARQREVADLVAAGHTNRQIARSLGISEKTAELHVGNILQRLGAPNRAGVAAWVAGRARDGPDAGAPPR